jgi:SAM-dependent methyltransferase
MRGLAAVAGQRREIRWAAGRVRVYPDPVYSDAAAAALYDVLNPWAPSDEFYLRLVMAAPSVVDIGCGTGQILHRARSSGHTGRLCGLDPDPAMLDVARRRAGADAIEWLAGPAASMEWQAQFQLAIMTGHAFQCLVTDEAVSESLAAIRRALTAGGRFAFETRNPAARAWESWATAAAAEAVDPSGRPVRVSHQVESVSRGVVTLTETTVDAGGTALRVDRAQLRFLEPAQLAGFLARAGLTIEAQYGDWEAAPLTSASREIITIARA